MAIPVKNEAERIRACLLALILQRDVPADMTVLVVNNTTDDTAAVIRRTSETWSFPAEIIEHEFAPECASAGAARRMAMERAATLAGPSGFVLTTDADGRVPPDWVGPTCSICGEESMRLADGRCSILPTKRLIPARLLEDDALECAYAAASG